MNKAKIVCGLGMAIALFFAGVQPILAACASPTDQTSLVALLNDPAGHNCDLLDGRYFITIGSEIPLTAGIELKGSSPILLRGLSGGSLTATATVTGGNKAIIKMSSPGNKVWGITITATGNIGILITGESNYVIENNISLTGGPGIVAMSPDPIGFGISGNRIAVTGRQGYGIFLSETVVETGGYDVNELFCLNEISATSEARETNLDVDPQNTIDDYLDYNGPIAPNKCDEYLYGRTPPTKTLVVICGEQASGIDAHKCVCNAGYTTDASTGKCIAESTTTPTPDCSIKSNEELVGGVCVCKAGYHDSAGTCIANDGGQQTNPCDKANELKNADGTCGCKDGYTWDPSGACVAKPVTTGTVTLPDDPTSTNKTVEQEAAMHVGGSGCGCDLGTTPTSTLQTLLPYLAMVVGGVGIGVWKRKKK